VTDDSGTPVSYPSHSKSNGPRGGPPASPFSHEYWEEVYLIEGDLTVDNDANGDGGASFPPHTYAVRPPHARHGPFKSEKGCLLLEIHYFDPV
jgi:hypothetical protein